MNIRVPQQRSQLFRNIVQFYLNRNADKRFKAFPLTGKTLPFVNIHRLFSMPVSKTCTQAKQEPGDQGSTEDGTNNVYG